MAAQIFKGRTISTLTLIVANAAVTERGNTACIDTATGTGKPASNTPNTLLPIGQWLDSVTGDGSKTNRLRLYKEVTLVPFVNDTAGNAITATDLFKPCFLSASGAASKATNGGNAPTLGLPVMIDTDGTVYVMPTNPVLH